MTVRAPSGAEATAHDKLNVTADDLTVTGVHPAAPAPGGRLTLTGSGFFAPGDVTFDQKPMPHAGPAAVYLVTTHASRLARPKPRLCPPVGPTATDWQITVQVPPSLKTDDGAGTFGLVLKRGGRTYTPTQVITVN